MAKSMVYLVAWCDGDSAEYSTDEPTIIGIKGRYSKTFLSKAKANKYAKETNNLLHKDLIHGAGMRVYPLRVEE